MPDTFDPTQFGAVAVAEDEPFDPLKAGAIPAEQGASPTPETDKAVAAVQNPELTPTLNKYARSVVKYAEDMIPSGVGSVLRNANVPTDWKNPTQLTEFVAPPTKLFLDTVQNAQARTDQIYKAWKNTPPGSQERADALVGAGLDAAQLATMLFTGGEGAKLGGEVNAVKEGAIPKVGEQQYQQANARGIPAEPSSSDLNVKSGEVLPQEKEAPVLPQDEGVLAQPVSSPAQGPVISEEKPKERINEEEKASAVGQTSPEKSEVTLPSGTAPASTVPESANVGAESPETGISNERLNQIYGEDAVLAGKGRGPQEWQEIGQADKRDPYAVLSATQKQGIAAPKDVALFRAEHQRLVNQARNAYGTPQYDELATRAANMANAIKTVAHGPASDVFRALQDADIPKYDSPADFDRIVRERMNRESTPEEKNTFNGIANELKNGDREVISTASEAQNRLRQYKPKDVVSFDDAVNHIKDQIKSLTTDCNL